MSKSTLTKEIQAELEKLNDRIDRKIIKGRPYEKDAERHRELLATLRNMNEKSRVSTRSIRSRSKYGRSPVRRRLSRGVTARLFGFGLVS